MNPNSWMPAGAPGAAAASSLNPANWTPSAPGAQPQLFTGPSPGEMMQAMGQIEQEKLRQQASRLIHSEVRIPATLTLDRVTPGLENR